MSDNGGRRAERGAKELTLRPFATRESETSNVLDLSRCAQELFDEESVKSDKQGTHVTHVGAAATSETERGVNNHNRCGDGYGQAGIRASAPHRRSLTEREKLILERRRKVNQFLAICIAAVVFVAVLLLSWFLLIIDEINVTDNMRFSAEEVIAESGLKAGRHILLANLAQAKRNIEHNPYIASASIKRVYPDKLLISVSERVEAAVIVGLNAQAVIDAEGYVLTIGARDNYSGLIQVSGMGFGGYHVGQRLGEESDFNSRTLVALLEAIYAAGIEDEIDVVDLSNPLSVSMLTLDGLTLHIGQPDDLDNKLANYVAVLKKLAEMGLDGSGTLDLGAMGDPVYSAGESGEALPNISPSPVTAGASPGDGEPSQSPDPTSGDQDDAFSG